jgi:deoxyribodipyrimidine photo-lyase
LIGRGSPYVVDPGFVVKDDGTSYSMFTPFRTRWRTHRVDAPLEPPAVDWLGAPDVACDGQPVGIDPGCELPDVGEAAAHARWSTFTAGALATYDRDRNLPAVDGTSHMSADLRWGVVHPRQLLADLDHNKATQMFASELAWRDFYADVLYRHPDSGRVNLDLRMDAMPVDSDAGARRRFAAWCEGRTGFPIVDAGMRQLLSIGWMHNRVRMIVASLLVKDLHLPWQWGARHFMNHLIDGDLASNAHGWQWTAGTGTDAAPYFRVFNPFSQAERFDPDGQYARQWISELDTDAYPAPMVEHATERIEALRRYGFVAASSR